MKNFRPFLPAISAWCAVALFLAQCATTCEAAPASIDVVKLSQGERAGMINDAYRGVPVWPVTKYRAAVWARNGQGFSGPQELSIQSNDGKTTFTRADIPRVGPDRKKYQVALTTNSVQATHVNALAMPVSGEIYLPNQRNDET